MNLKEVEKLVTLNINAFPSTFINVSEKQLNAMAVVWYEVLKNFNFEQIQSYVVKALLHANYPIAIGDITREIEGDLVNSCYVNRFVKLSHECASKLIGFSPAKFSSFPKTIQKFWKNSEALYQINKFTKEEALAKNAKIKQMFSRFHLNEILNGESKKLLK